MTRLATVALVLLFCTGCAHRQLTRSTLDAGATLTDLQYSIILSNIAMLSIQPEALPWGLKISAGTIQASNALNPAVSLTFGDPSGTVSIGANAQVTIAWSVVPVTDTGELNALIKDYREAMADRSWFHESSSAPEDAVYAGRYGKKWVWVDSSGVPRLTQLTLRVLASTRIKPGDRLLAPGLLVNR
jgi:hypothetical protein